MNRKKKAAACSPEHLVYDMNISNSDQELHLSLRDVISDQKKGTVPNLNHL